MFGLPAKAGPAGPAALIVALTVVFLGAMAFAVPPAPIRIEAGSNAAGYLVSHDRFTDLLAEQKATDGYAYLAIDLTRADLADDAPWRQEFDLVTSRRVPLWGWVDVRNGLDRARELVRSLNLAGLYVYGPDAVACARQLRGLRPALRVIPVLRMQDPAGTAADDYALLMTVDDFVSGEVEAPVSILIADQLDAVQVLDARARAAGDYVVAEIAILDWQ